MSEDFKANLEWLRSVDQRALEEHVLGGEQVDGPYDHPNLHHSFTQVHTELDFMSTDGTHQVCTYLMAAQGPERGCVVLFHGMHGHAGSLSHMAAQFAKAGFWCYAMDFVHHGRSQGEKGLICDFSVLHEDAARLVYRVRQRHPGLKVFAGGQSMGGMVATNMELDRPGISDGLVLLAPAVSLGMRVSRWQLALVRALSYLPDFGLVPQGMRDGTKHNLREEFMKDPLNYTGRLYPVYLRRITLEMERVGAALSSLKAPFVLFFGGKDRLVDPRCVLQYDKSASPDRSIYIFKDMWHAITLEEQAPEVASLAVQWLHKRT
jgi:acylglycerol lipase